MQQWFSKFIRGKTFSTLFFILGIGLIFYLSLRLGEMAKAFWGYDCYLLILIAFLTFFLYMLLYFHMIRNRKKTHKLFELCEIIFCFLISMVLAFLLYDAANIFMKITDKRGYLVPLILSVMFTCCGFLHARKIYVKKYHVQITGSKTTQKRKIALISDIHVGHYVNNVAPLSA